MALKLNSLKINLGVALFLLTLVAGQTYWLCVIRDMNWSVALTDGLGSYLLIYAIFLFIRYSPSFYIPKYIKYGVIDLQGLFLTIVWVYVCRYLLLNIFPEPAYVAVWHSTVFIRGFIGWILICFFITIHLFASEFTQYQTASEQKQATEQLRKEAELFKLRQQIQPHFLFNSLNSINALIGSQPQKARLMVQNLSDYLRNNIRKEDSEWGSIQEELTDLKLYLSIEQVRFGHRLSVSETLNLSNTEAKIPPFLIQPLVENAIKFGLYGTIGKVGIAIDVKEVNEKLIFQISNPFDEDNVMPKGTGFGLVSIRRRLYLLYSRNDLLTTERRRQQGTDQNYFTARLVLPLNIQETESFENPNE